jgi:hypothetical protein
MSVRSHRTATNAVRLKEPVASISEAHARMKEPLDAVVVVRGRPRWFVMSCPCGCGETLTTNLDKAAGPAWSLYADDKNEISIFPSIWREGACGSHFIIWRNKVFLFGDWSFEEEWESTLDDADLTNRVQNLLSREPKNYTDIALQLNAIPWDVLTCLRRLVKNRVAHEGKKKQRGLFWLA